MEIIYFDSIDSTQLYLKEKIRNNELKSPIAVVAKRQINGIGSRGNKWHSNTKSLFMSFSLKIDDLDKSIKTQSYSIYFSFVAYKVLQELGSKTWIKWPNDLYLNDKKIGGVITNIIKDEIIVGIGINFAVESSTFEKVDVDIGVEDYIKLFFKKLDSKVSWKEVMDEFIVEFDKHRNVYVNLDKKKISLQEAKLNDDGSITVNGMKQYSLR